LAIRQLLRLVNNEKDYSIIHALDGPKGPALKIKPGFNWFAEKTNKPTLLMSFEYSKSIELNSWDKMKIPLPFSKVEVDFKY
jgi:lysophospholipid acyltransferase (LPLAT)-like uncharacterized protein